MKFIKKLINNYTSYRRRIRKRFGVSLSSNVEDVEFKLVSDGWSFFRARLAKNRYYTTESSFLALVKWLVGLDKTNTFR